MVECSSGSVTEPEAETGTGRETFTLDAVHDLLRDRILQGQLAPGSVVSQAHLARDLGVSRSPIREACRMLEREGLVVSTGLAGQMHGTWVRFASTGDPNGGGLPKWPAHRPGNRVVMAFGEASGLRTDFSPAVASLWALDGAG